MLTKYFGGLFVRSLLRFARCYLRLAIAEAKFLLQLMKLPFATDGRFKAFRQAVQVWILRLYRALMPSWILSFRQSPSLFKRLLSAVRLVMHLLTYLYQVVVMKQMLVIAISEFLRLKRLVIKTVNKSRKLRVRDSTQ